MTEQVPETPKAPAQFEVVFKDAAGKPAYGGTCYTLREAQDWARRELRLPGSALYTATINGKAYKPRASHGKYG